MKDKLGAICLFFLALFVGTDSQTYTYDYMEDECGSNRTIDLSARNKTYGIVRVSRYGGYHANLHCDLNIKAPPDHQLVFRFRRIEIYRPSADCSVDFVRVTNFNRTVTMCGYGTPVNAYESHGRDMRITFHSASWSGNNYRIGFELVYTSYFKGNCEKGKHFKCSKESRCIPAELTCDNYDNCGDWSDERGCPLSTSTIIGLVFASLFVFGMAGCCAMYACQTSKANKNRRRTAQNNRNNHRVTSDGQRATIATVGSGGGEYGDLYGPYNEPPPPYTHLPVASTVGVNNAGFDPNPEYTPPNFASIAPPSYARDVMAGRVDSNGPNTVSSQSETSSNPSATQLPTYAATMNQSDPTNASNSTNEVPVVSQSTTSQSASSGTSNTAASSAPSIQNAVSPVDQITANQDAANEHVPTAGAPNKTVSEQGSSIINVQPATSMGDVHVAVNSAKDTPLSPVPKDSITHGQGNH